MKASRNASETEHLEYIFPARKVAGTRTAVVEQLDELIAGIGGLRQIVTHGAPVPPAPKPKRRLRILRAILPAIVGLATVLAASSAAAQSGAGAAEPPQAAADPNPGAVTVTGGVDAVNQYMFRGIRQNSTGIAVWPWADLGVALWSGDGGVKSVGLNLGSWNSLNTGDTGVDGPSGKLWYESDFYATFGLGFGGGVSTAVTYTAYTSPNSMFSNVRELMFKLAVDDSAHFGKAAVKPYVVIAREFDTAPGVGQADGGTKAGTYLEFGVAPGYAGSKASLAVPIKLGLSLGNYYELSGDDHRFGFFSVAGIVTVPLGATNRFGGWNLHGGVEFQKLGDTTAFFNAGKRTQVIGSVGIGFTY
jgi:hypothetical protein